MKLHRLDVRLLREIASRDVSIGQKRELCSPLQPGTLDFRKKGIIPIDFELP